ncbi:hypothetical protein [Streptomyces alfalfae]
MANKSKPEPEVLHYRGVLTPFQEWHNEPPHAGVPAELSAQLGELNGTDRFKSRRRAMQVARKQLQSQPPQQCPGLPWEEDLIPGYGPTCGFGEAKRIIICLCKRGEHE